MESARKKGRRLFEIPHVKLMMNGIITFLTLKCIEDKKGRVMIYAEAKPINRNYSFTGYMGWKQIKMFMEEFERVSPLREYWGQKKDLKYYVGKKTMEKLYQRKAEKVEHYKKVDEEIRLYKLKQSKEWYYKAKEERAKYGRELTPAERKEMKKKKKGEENDKRSQG